MMRKVIVSIVAAMLPLLVSAQWTQDPLGESIPIGGLKYYINENTHEAMVANSNCWSGELVIPAEVIYQGQSYVVSRIAWRAFFDCETLTKVTIPKTVRDIYTISVNPAANNNPFVNCTSLEAIEVEEGNQWMCAVDGVLYNAGRTELYGYPAGKQQQTFAVDEGVVRICSSAFAYNSHLVSIQLPNTVTKIDGGAFQNCLNLERVNLPEGIDYLGEWLFQDCAKLKTIEVPPSVKGVGERAFKGCTSLSVIDLPAKVEHIGYYAFNECKLNALVIRGHVENYLTSNVFYGLDKSSVLYVPTEDVDRYKAVYDGTVLPLEDYETKVFYPEGTKWTEIRLDTLMYDSWYSKVGDEWVPNFETIEYFVKGEYTTMYGEKFKCVYTNGPEWTDSLTLGICETEYNGDNCILVTVFVCDYIGTFGVLWPGIAYQFDWSAGKGLYFEDIMMSNTTTAYPYYFYYGIIDEIKEDYFGGVRQLKYVDLDGKAPVNYQEPGNTDTNGGRIIQGIGITEWNEGECLFGPARPYEALSMFGEIYCPERHYRSMLVHFERNGEVLYDVWPVKGTTDVIKAVSKEGTPTADTPYDLQGRKMQQPPQKGIYIKNGRKYVVK